MKGNDRRSGGFAKKHRTTKHTDKPNDPRQLTFWAALFPVHAEKDCRKAAGYRNDTSLNNVGSNGNYWSSSLNTSNSNNARELNFNSSNHNTDNNNNRYNGQSVRPVTAITRTRLLADLYLAYLDARRHKRGQRYQLDFEMNLEESLCRLADELIKRTYVPGRSSVFVVREPKQREVFAADFRDRVVHHLYYRYTHKLFESTFIYDTYSCIKGRGTHFGIKRLQQHIRQESRNYTCPCYILKMDIEGYFINIKRQRLLSICKNTLEGMSRHRLLGSGNTWEETIDYDLVEWLTEVFTLQDPISDFTFAMPMSEWEGLPRSKSLFYAKSGCGLPIGNLTSQLFSNIYLNQLDQYMKRRLHCRHYGRYVDDFYVVSCNRDWLEGLVPQVNDFLNRELELNLHNKKVEIRSVNDGVEFLGQYVLPYRCYTSKRSFSRIERGMGEISTHDWYDDTRLLSQINSYLGVLGHTRSHRKWLRLLQFHPWVFRFGVFNEGMHKFLLFDNKLKATPRYSSKQWQ